MNKKTYQRFRIVIAIFTSVIVGMAVTRDNAILAAAGVLVGMAFMVAVRSKTKIQIDEREKYADEIEAAIKKMKE